MENDDGTVEELSPYEVSYVVQQYHERKNHREMMAMGRSALGKLDAFLAMHGVSKRDIEIYKARDLYSQPTNVVCAMHSVTPQSLQGRLRHKKYAAQARTFYHTINHPSPHIGTIVAGQPGLSRLSSSLLPLCSLLFFFCTLPFSGLSSTWCPEGDSDPHAFRPLDFKSRSSAIPTPGLRFANQDDFAFHSIARAFHIVPTLYTTE